MTSDQRDGMTPSNLGEPTDQQSPAGNQTPARQAILVLGMHRSGTSAVTRLINLLGADLPQNLLPPLEDNNETGFWESRDLYEAHEEFIQALGLRWDLPVRLDLETAPKESVERFKARALEVLKRDFSDSTLFTLKDPRLCALLPLWREILSELGVTTKALLPLRNPLEVAASLQKRDGFIIEKSVLLWLRHMLDAEHHSRGVERCFIGYDTVLENWRGAADKMAADLDVTWPRPIAECEAEIDAFLRPGQRHHSYTLDQIQDSPQVVDWVARAYAAMLALAGGPSSGQETELDKIWAEMSKPEKAFGPVIAFERSFWHKLEGDLETAQADLRDRDEQIGVRDSRLTQLGEELKNAKFQATQAAHTATQLAKQAKVSRDEFEKILASPSWRVTQPLRDAKAALRSFVPGLRTGVKMLGWAATFQLGRQMALRADCERIKKSGQFDPDWYRQQISEQEAADADLIAHYVYQGAAAGLDPNPLFDTSWYLETYPEVAKSGRNPLAHYLDAKLAEGYNPNPYFDTAWYLETNIDLGDLRLHPLRHFLILGAAEGRNPSPRFNTRDYLLAHPEVADSGENPLAHFLHAGGEIDETAPDEPPCAPESTASDPARERAKGTPPKILAWYLPQFHPVPENDEWWGKGFTEWTNVTKARPLYEGHEQPKLPADLGFYDLRLPETRRRQAELAREHGIHGFVYHYYWFNGRKILEHPIETMLQSGEPDFPFCISWANENWTRRWDGQESEILLPQVHSLESDLEFLRDVMPLLKDPRYITCEGKPVLIIYRAELVQNMQETAAAWRDEAQRAGLPGLHICAVEWMASDPRPLGLDALVGFPPHNFAQFDCRKSVSGLSKAFTGRIFDYAKGVKRAIEPSERPYTYYRGVMPAWDNTARRKANATIYHGASPAIFEYWLWSVAKEASEKASSKDHFVFVNAWNEWAEGACLEPDQRHGLEWLEATRRVTSLCAEGPGPELHEPVKPLALQKRSLREHVRDSPLGPPLRQARQAYRDLRKPKITPQEAEVLPEVRWSPAPPSRGPRTPVLLVSHDAVRAGAQLVLLELTRAFSRRDDLEPWVLLRAGGELEPEFAELARTFNLATLVEDGVSFERAIEMAIRDFKTHQPAAAICNTVVGADVAAVCKRYEIPVLSLVHELPTSIESYVGKSAINNVMASSDEVVVVSEFVRDRLCEAYDLPRERLHVIHGGAMGFERFRSLNHHQRGTVLKEFGFPDDCFLVLGCGSVHHRKGTDLFVQVAREAMDLPGADRMRFLWVGEDQAGPTFRQWCEHDLAAAGLRGKVVLAHGRSDPLPYFAAADAFALTSREDPFPLVNLEAMASGLPVVAFAGAGGAAEAYGEDAGLVVPYLDSQEMARELVALANDTERAAKIGAAARQRIDSTYRMERFIDRVTTLLLSDVVAEPLTEPAETAEKVEAHA